MTVASLRPGPGDAPRTVLVLGGGGALGAYQAGALLALAEAGIVLDAMFGCSVGALNAAFLASDPGLTRARELTHWWADTRLHEVIAPSRWGQLRGLAFAAVRGGQGVFDERPLRRLISDHVRSHDVAELAVPLTVTTTCLDCGTAVHTSRGPVGDLLVASCALPGLFGPVRLPDGHRHVDGGVLCGVPLARALQSAGPDDRVLVLDCALAPVTGRPGHCAGVPCDPAAPGTDAVEACGLPVVPGHPTYVPPMETRRGALEVVLSAFTVARAAANRASIGSGLDDPRVQVLPHVADAWAAGLLPTLPTGPRDCNQTGALLTAGQDATAAWLDRAGSGAGFGAAADEHAGEWQGHLA